MTEDIGAAQERATIVAWLRDSANSYDRIATANYECGNTAQADWCWARHICLHEQANTIERGDHTNSKGESE